MGKKVNPIILRISNPKNHAFNWHSLWFSNKKNFANYLKEDERIRKFVRQKVLDVGIDKIIIERSGKGDLEIILPVAKPGVIIGRGGEKSEQLKKELQRLLNKRTQIRLTIKEIRKPNLSAEVLCDEAKKSIERRMPFRKVMKKILDMAQKAGAEGAKIGMAGRLNGVEIARREKLSLGRMPLQTLRANVDYARSAAHTKWGQIGIKIWVYKGNVFDTQEEIENNSRQRG